MPVVIRNLIFAAVILMGTVFGAQAQDQSALEKDLAKVVKLLDAKAFDAAGQILEPYNSNKTLSSSDRAILLYANVKVMESKGEYIGLVKMLNQADPKTLQTVRYNWSLPVQEYLHYANIQQKSGMAPAVLRATILIEQANEYLKVKRFDAAYQIAQKIYPVDEDTEFNAAVLLMQSAIGRDRADLAAEPAKKLLALSKSDEMSDRAKLEKVVTTGETQKREISLIEERSAKVKVDEIDLKAIDKSLWKVDILEPVSAGRFLIGTHAKLFLMDQTGLSRELLKVSSKFEDGRIRLSHGRDGQLLVIGMDEEYDKEVGGVTSLVSILNADGAVTFEERFDWAIAKRNWGIDDGVQLTDGRVLVWRNSTYNEWVTNLTRFHLVNQDGSIDWTVMLPKGNDDCEKVIAVSEFANGDLNIFCKARASTTAGSMGLYKVALQTGQLSSIKRSKVSAYNAAASADGGFVTFSNTTASLIDAYGDILWTLPRKEGGKLKSVVNKFGHVTLSQVVEDDDSHSFCSWSFNRATRAEPQVLPCRDLQLLETGTSSDAFVSIAATNSTKLHFKKLFKTDPSVEAILPILKPTEVSDVISAENGGTVIIGRRMHKRIDNYNAASSLYVAYVSNTGRLQWETTIPSQAGKNGTMWPAKAIVTSDQSVLVYVEDTEQIPGEVKWRKREKKLLVIKGPDIE